MRDTLALVKESAASMAPDDPGLTSWFRQYCEAHAMRIAEDVELVERHAARGDQIADVGCVPLLLTTALARLGHDVTGIDIAPDRFSRSISANGLTVIQCNIETETIPAAVGSFDVVIFNEIFEHLRINLIATMREIHRILKPGGTLLLSTPNLRSLKGVCNLVLRGKGHAVGTTVWNEWEKLESLGHMGHVREYTPREMRDFLGRCGFDVTETVFRDLRRRPATRVLQRFAPGLLPFATYVGCKRAG